MKLEDEVTILILAAAALPWVFALFVGVCCR